jgi:hypothetical protein
MTEEIVYSTGECFLGALLVATSSRGVCAILPARWLARAR